MWHCRRPSIDGFVHTFQALCAFVAMVAGRYRDATPLRATGTRLILFGVRSIPGDGNQITLKAIRWIPLPGFAFEVASSGESGWPARTGGFTSCSR